MMRAISYIVDELFLFTAVHTHFRGLERRLPPYTAAVPFDAGELRSIAAPALVETTPLPPWRGWRRERFCFASPRDCGIPESRAVVGITLGLDPAAPWVVLIHGLTQGIYPPGDYGLFTRIARSLAQSGLNVALFELPLHMSRQRPGYPSGEGFLSQDLRLTQAVMLQAAGDTIAVARWLQQRYGRPVGLLGNSIGGCPAGLAAACLDDLAAVALVLPLDNPGDLLAAHPRLPWVRAAFASGKVTPGEVIAALRSVSPSAYRPAVSPERIHFILGRWDRMALAARQTAWWEAWGRPSLQLLNSGHITAGLYARSLLRSVTGFLATRLTLR